MCRHRRRAEGSDKNHQLFLILIWSGEQVGLFHSGRVDEEFGSAWGKRRSQVCESCPLTERLRGEGRDTRTRTREGKTGECCHGYKSLMACGHYQEKTRFPCRIAPATFEKKKRIYLALRFLYVRFGGDTLKTCTLKMKTYPSACFPTFVLVSCFIIASNKFPLETLNQTLLITGGHRNN